MYKFLIGISALCLSSMCKASSFDQIGAPQYVFQHNVKPKKAAYDCAWIKRSNNNNAPIVVLTAEAPYSNVNIPAFASFLHISPECYYGLLLRTRCLNQYDSIRKAWYAPIRYKKKGTTLRIRIDNGKDAIFKQSKQKRSNPSIPSIYCDSLACWSHSRQCLQHTNHLK